MNQEVETALVTGASRGIGRAIAEELARRGHFVIGTATSEAGAEAIEGYLQGDGLTGRGMVLDVADMASVSSLAGTIEKDGHSPGILINNAGITRDNLLMRMKPEEWDAVINTNLNSLYRMCRTFIRPMMKRRQGRVVNITSVVGAMGNAGQSNYAAAKAGVIGFTRALAREVGSRKITVNAVAPGFIDTDMTRALSEDQRNGLQTQIPLGRLGDVEDVAAAVCFLSSPEAAYITGETLHVNGGMYMS